MPVKTNKDNLKTVAVDFNSTVDNQRYVGSFTIKKLSIRDLAALGVRKAQLNGGLHYDAENPGRGVDEQTDDFNNMIAHLELAIVDAPAWWNMDQIGDVQLIGHIYQEVISFENSFLRRQPKPEGQSGGAGEGTSQAGDKESKSGAAASQVVGGEVQAALEP